MHSRDQKDDSRHKAPDETDEARRFGERVTENYDRIAQAVYRGRLTACDDCGRLVSRRALSCPTCGALNGAKALRIALYLAGAAALASLFSAHG